MKTEKKLYRVDLNLKYLVYTDTEYKQKDVSNWIKNDFHSGELDDVCEISMVKDVKEIQDFIEMGVDYYPYCPYYTNEEDEETFLCDIIDKLGLDAKKLIKRLESLGYKVTKK